MKLILTQEVTGLGAPGDIVEVKDGYGRNYLLPRGLAIRWTRGGEKQITTIRRAARSARSRDLGQATGGQGPARGPHASRCRSGPVTGPPVRLGHRRRHRRRRRQGRWPAARQAPDRDRPADQDRRHPPGHRAAAPGGRRHRLPRGRRRPERRGEHRATRAPNSASGATLWRGVFCARRVVPTFFPPQVRGRRCCHARRLSTGGSGGAVHTAVPRGFTAGALTVHRAVPRLSTGRV